MTSEAEDRGPRTELKDWLPAAEAARLLGVTRATLYAYVSRGFLRSEARESGTRERRYSHEDVERLRRRGEEHRDPSKAAANALQWGMPILESSITLIADGCLYYRGHDVARLAEERSLLEVASLLWTGSFDADYTSTPIHVVAPGDAQHGLSVIARWQSALAVIGARDPFAFDLRPKTVEQTGWRILHLMTSVLAATADLEPTIDATLARAWLPRHRKAGDVIRAALILSADHELNVSSFTARCIASAASDPYAVAIGGLSAIEGAKHGGVSARVEAFVQQLDRSRNISAAISDRLRRGEAIEGFGHRLYPRGDPRAAILLEMLGSRFGKSRELRLMRDIASAVEEILGEKPTIDFALVALSRVLSLPDGSPLALFALGRTMGWIAHALEQYQLGSMIRPRAKYVGPMCHPEQGERSR